MSHNASRNERAAAEDAAAAVCTTVDIKIRPPDGLRECWVVEVCEYSDPTDPIDSLCLDCATDENARQLAAAIALLCVGAWVR